MDESFDDELRRRLKQFSEEPEDRLWPSISARIEAEDRAARMQKKMRIGWIFIFASFIMGGFFYVFNLESKRSPSIIAEKSQEQLQKATPNEGVAPPNERIQLRPENTTDKLETEGRYPNQDLRNIQSNGLSANQISEPIPNSGQEEEKSSDDAVNQTKISNGSNSSVVSEQALDSINALTFVKTETKKKLDKNQDNDISGENKQNRLSIYFTIMPTLGYQRIEPNSNDNLIVESIERISTFSTDRLGVRAELGVEYPIDNRLNVFGGLVYFQREQTIGYTEKVVSETEISQGPDGEIILKPEFSYENKSFEYEVRNLGLQVGLSYQLAKRKFLQTLGTGVEFHVALNKFDETEEVTNNPSAYVFYNLYYRVQYPTDTKLRAVVQPTLNYSFYINQNRDAPFYVKPYGLGLNIGFTYNLN